MKLSLWQRIIALRGDIGSILEQTMMTGAQLRAADRTIVQLIDQNTLSGLRVELRAKLDTLKDGLSREMSEAEVYLVMFPLVLLCDEMVMARVPKEQQTLWLLLQSELFQINYGGDVFYDFVDERLAKPETPALVFEVLYYCLSAGFVGKFGLGGGKVQRYRALLSERIPGALGPRRKARRHREDAQRSPPEERAAAAPSTQTLAPPAARSALWYYAATLGVLLLAICGVLLLSNL